MDTPVFEGSDANMIWMLALDYIMERGGIQEGRDQQTKEILHAVFRLSDPRSRIITTRPINPAFAIAEIIWILSGSGALSTIAWWNSRMKNYSDNGKVLHGAYGARLGTQLEHAYLALRNNMTRRDVVLQIWDREKDLSHTKYPKAKDIPCNVISHLLVRDGKLEWTQFMRSNDLIWGTPYNFIQWTTIQEIMAGWLGLEVGSYVHISNSLHVYERHWQHALEILQVPTFTNPASVDDLRMPYEEWKIVFESVWEAYHIFPQAANYDEVMEIMSKVAVPDAYRNWLRVLAAETFRKLGLRTQARNMVEGMDNFRLRVSFMKWLVHKETMETDRT